MKHVWLGFYILLIQLDTVQSVIHSYRCFPLCGSTLEKCNSVSLLTVGLYLIYSLRSKEIRYSVLSYAICGWLNSSFCKQIFMVQQYFRFLILSVALNNFTSFFSPNENCLTYSWGKFLGIRVWPLLSIVTSSLYRLGSMLFLQDLNSTCAILSRWICLEDCKRTETAYSWASLAHLHRCVSSLNCR